MSDELVSGLVYEVVVNAEGEYSIWRADMRLPAGWHLSGYRGSETDCLDHIGRVWSDMRPISLRRFMDGDAHDGEKGIMASRGGDDHESD